MISHTSALHQPAFSLPRLTLTARLQSQGLWSSHEKALQENEPPALQGNQRQSAWQVIPHPARPLPHGSAHRELSSQVGRLRCRLCGPG